MKEQIQQFKNILEQRGFSIDDFELNVDGETFRLLFAGGEGDLEVCCRESNVKRTYRCDGTSSWLEQFSDDLIQGLFS